MSRRGRVTAKKSRREDIHRNVNPKLNAFQRQKKRDRMARTVPS